MPTLIDDVPFKTVPRVRTPWETPSSEQLAKWAANGWTLETDISSFGEMNALKARLLSYGGAAVVMNGIDEDCAAIMSRGLLLTGYGSIKERMQSNGCHRNASYLWKMNRDKLTLMTGYALSKDGMWRCHSWCWDREAQKPVETTTKRIVYYGFPMTEDEALHFFDINW